MLPYAFNLLLHGLFLSGVQSSEWKYTGSTGTDKWASFASACGYSSQSPINIDTTQLLPDPNLGLLELDGYQHKLTGGDFINNGHTVQLNFPPNKTYQLSGEGINGTYRALQLHFHWRSSNSTTGGSEHTVNGMHYDAEMHIVHIKNPLDMNQIKDLKDGLAVIGVFLATDPQAEDNPHFELLLNAAKHALYKGESAELNEGPSLLSLLPLTGSYYRYYGSLTTPPCFESVLWTIYHQPVVISMKQLRIFQNFKVETPKQGLMESKHTAAADTDDQNHENSPSDHPISIDEDDAMNELGDNYRPVQAKNGRVVTAYYDIGVKKEKEGAGTWHYEGEKGPDYWYEENESCKGHKQSPINIITNSTTLSTSLEKIKFSQSYFTKTSGYLENNGHTVKYTLAESGDEVYFDNSNKKYRAIQVHFHWGRAVFHEKTVTSMGGSEHTVNGEHFPIEMHIVHSKVASEDDEDHEDDFAVISVFFTVQDEKRLDSDTTSDELKTISKMFGSVHYDGDATEIEEGPVLLDLLPANKSYYRYMGSLTTPPCTERVMWTIFTHPVYVAEERLLEFQSLFKVKQSDVIPMNSTTTYTKKDSKGADPTLDEALLQGNFRPTQAYYSRTVLIYVDEDVVVVPPETDVVAIVLWTVGGLIIFAAVLALMICCKPKGDKKKTSSIYRQVGSQPPPSAAETI